MQLIEIETKMGKDGMIQIPQAELDATGLKEGDDVCLVYLSKEGEEGEEKIDEFILEKNKL